MMSNKGLNSKEALDESTATNSSVTLSGIRREKEAPTDLDIEEYSRNLGKSEPGSRLRRSYGEPRLRPAVAGHRLEVTGHSSLITGHFPYGNPPPPIAP